MSFLQNFFKGIATRFGPAYRASCGLYYDDLLIETPEVDEAVRRLPEDVRAARFSFKQKELPQHMWVTEEQDVRYLKPYVDQVLSEKNERIAANSN